MTKKVIPMKVLKQGLSMLWEEDRAAHKAAGLIHVILGGGSARLSDIARQLPGKEGSHYRWRRASATLKAFWGWGS